MNACRKHYAVLFFNILVLPIFSQNELSYGKKIKFQNSEFVYDSASFRSCHASTLVETSEGIMVSWFGGTAEGRPDVCIYVSQKQGGIWSTPELVADGVINDTLRFPCWNPVLYTRRNGDIILFYKVGPSPREWWGLYKISKNGGLSWSEEVRIPDNHLGPIKNKPQELKNGKILYPTSIENAQNEWRIQIETSDQNLRNWNRTDIDNNGFNAIQPTILFYKGGRIQLLCRSREKRIVETWSDNNGRTWSRLQATSLANNNSGLDAVTLSNGLQLLICNLTVQGRNKLNLLASADGINWEELLILEDQPKGEFSYPAIIEGKDGSVHITYTFNRRKIKYVHLNL